MEIESGSGLFLSAGSFLLRVSSTRDTYERITISGEGSDGSGNYIYNADGAQGIVNFVDSSIGEGSVALTFLNSTSGEFLMSAVADSNSFQSGTFEEQ